jgi:hypothetical protein
LNVSGWMPPLGEEFSSVVPNRFDGAIQVNNRYFAAALSWKAYTRDRTACGADPTNPTVVSG